jgi:hypothetical protein
MSSEFSGTRSNATYERRDNIEKRGRANRRGVQILAGI